MIKINIDKDLVEYLKNNSTIIFVNYFYGIFLDEKDISDFNDYRKVILLRSKDLSCSEISKLINVSRRKIEHWVYDNNRPFIIRLLEHYLILGKPKRDLKWLSINSTRGGLFTGPWIQVPIKVNNYNDVRLVIKQLTRLNHNQNKLFNKNLIYNKKENLFAYLLGVMVGDASKTGIKRKQRVIRRICLRLSKRYPTNEKFGEFVRISVNELGLRMNKCKDCPAGKKSIHPFYTWISQSSPLFQWIFNGCLGLENNELTTYNPIRAKWILGSSRDFKISFLQGLADSDGFVDFSSHQVGIITEPNTYLIKNIFDSLNVKSTPKLFTRNKLWALMINANDAYRLPIFNPIIKSYRYEYLEKLFKARKFSGHWSLWLKEKVKENLKEGINGTNLVKKVIEEEGIAIRTKNIRRIAKKLE